MPLKDKVVIKKLHSIIMGCMMTSLECLQSPLAGDHHYAIRGLPTIHKA